MRVLSRISPFFAAVTLSWTVRVQAIRSCEEVKSGNPCSGGNFASNQLLVVEYEPFQTDPDGTTCQQFLDDLQVECDDEGNFVDLSHRINITITLPSYMCCRVLDNIPTCLEWTSGQQCGSGEVFANNEGLRWPFLNADDKYGRTCQVLLDEKDASVGDCNQDGGFATEADRQKVELHAMEFNLFGCCRAMENSAVSTSITGPADSEATSSATSSEPADSGTGTGTSAVGEPAEVAQPVETAQPLDPASMMDPVTLDDSAAIAGYCQNLRAFIAISVLHVLCT